MHNITSIFEALGLSFASAPMAELRYIRGTVLLLDPPFPSIFILVASKAAALNPVSFRGGAPIDPFAHRLISCTTWRISAKPVKEIKKISFFCNFLPIRQAPHFAGWGGGGTFKNLRYVLYQK